MKPFAANDEKISLAFHAHNLRRQKLPDIACPHTRARVRTHTQIPTHYTTKVVQERKKRAAARQTEKAEAFQGWSKLKSATEMAVRYLQDVDPLGDTPTRSAREYWLEVGTASADNICERKERSSDFVFLSSTSKTLPRCYSPTPSLPSLP